jgi:hypothetical protein
MKTSHTGRGLLRFLSVVFPVLGFLLAMHTYECVRLEKITVGRSGYSRVFEREASPAVYWFSVSVLGIVTAGICLSSYRVAQMAWSKTPIQSPVPTRGDGT